jgi:hypothetical protein
VAGVDTAIGLNWGEDGLRVCLSRVEDNFEDIAAIVSGSGRVAASADYLIDTIKALDSQSVRLDHDGIGTPILVTGANQGRAVIMPMAWLSRDEANDRMRRGELCPKCHSANVLITTRGSRDDHYACEDCGERWSEAPPCHEVTDNQEALADRGDRKAKF